MSTNVERLHLLVNSAENNGNIRVSDHIVKPGYSPEYLEELEMGLRIRYNEGLKSFYTTTASISLTWAADPSKVAVAIPADDLNRLTGAIHILNPFDMVMGKMGTRWKEELWFEDMKPSEKEQRRSFLPFDLPTTELMAGFRQEGGKVTDPMCLLSDNNGLLPFHLSLDEYIVYLEKTKGFSYWQQIVFDRDSPEFSLFMKYMPMLFPDFEKDFFNH
jgi:hypothetical protein